jgi:hypothetical protein
MLFFRARLISAAGLDFGVLLGFGRQKKSRGLL